MNAAPVPAPPGVAGAGAGAVVAGVAGVELVVEALGAEGSSLER